MSSRSEFVKWFHGEVIKGTIPCTHKESAWAAWCKCKKKYSK
ncbi:hypothetical protein PQC38_gp025 [Aeromonas phage BUCT695]|nr:hypothetical protein PQC38_gp025 [Aeromonas phage BUCT695]UIW10501.1 hypothetical protein [Aeromonas phage BUCT695]